MERKSCNRKLWKRCATILQQPSFARRTSFRPPSERVLSTYKITNRIMSANLNVPRVATVPPHKVVQVKKMAYNQSPPLCNTLKCQSIDVQARLKRETGAGEKNRKQSRQNKGISSGLRQRKAADASTNREQKGAAKHDQFSPRRCQKHRPTSFRRVCGASSHTAHRPIFGRFSNRMYAVPDGRYDNHDFRAALLRQLLAGRRADGRAGDRAGHCKPDARQVG